jgi:glyceraldehyde 3-phosphate dehydrogenase
LLLNHPTIEVVAINDLADGSLKYDSIHGVLPHKVGSDEKEFL